ncbi:Caffeate O-methyltransferase (COMT) family [Artemisia annua]|uniref:Caffeate O-methyltransferase (COMT) family n=1 Tax=Artemisia annua TaxID=35608 RepID=A0A2U1N5D0_ARTAN|nr:Caffeate O-methyltransferase (COMT) family [Artemisia annua]
MSGAVLLEEEELQRVMQMLAATILPMVMKTVIELDLFEIIVKVNNSGGEFTSSDIFSHLPIRNPQTIFIIERVLRYLASKYILTSKIVTDQNEDTKKLYSMTPICKYFVSNEDGVSFANFFLFQNDKEAVKEMDKRKVDEVSGSKGGELNDKDEIVETVDVSVTVNSDQIGGDEQSSEQEAMESNVSTPSPVKTHETSTSKSASSSALNKDVDTNNEHNTYAKMLKKDVNALNKELVYIAPNVNKDATASVCQMGVGKISYARVLVEVEAGKELKEQVKIEYIDKNKNVKGSKEVQVEYEWKPERCNHYNVFGHSFGTCNARPRTESELKEKAAEEEKLKNKNIVQDDGFIDVQYKKRNVMQQRKNGQYRNYGQNMQRQEYRKKNNGNEKGKEKVVEESVSNKTVDQNRRRGSNVNRYENWTKEMEDYFKTQWEMDRLKEQEDRVNNEEDVMEGVGEMAHTMTSENLVADNPHCSETKIQECNALKDYNEAVDEEEQFLFQKAKVDWICKGDRNNKFFHKVLKSKSHVNKIVSVMNDDGVVLEGELMENQGRT